MNDDEGRLKAEISKASDAQALLEHPLLVDAFNQIEEEIYQSWMNSPSRDAEGREKLWTMLHLCKKVRSLLETTVQTGKMASLTLDQRRTVAQKFKDWIGGPVYEN